MKQIINQSNTRPQLNVVGSANQYTADHIEDIYQECLGYTKCVMGVVNACAYYAMMNAYDKLKVSPLFNGRVKQLLNKAVKKDYPAYEARLKHGDYKGLKFFEAEQLTPEEIAKGRVQTTDKQLFDWFLDIGACAYNKSDKEVESLRFQVYQILTTHDVQYREELSHYCLANALLLYSVQVYDTLIREFKDKYHVNFAKAFSAFRMTSVAHSWFVPNVLLCKTPGQTIDLLQSQNVINALHIFEKAIMADVKYGVSADEAVEMNKDLLDPEVYQRYRQEYDNAKDNIHN